MARLPQPGADNGNWGTILNDYLTQTHKSDGSLKDNIITSTTIANDAVTATHIADGTISETQLTSAVQTKLNAVGTGNPITSTNITDSTTTGRAVLTAADAAAARSAIGAGTSSLTIGTTNTTAKAGDYTPTKADVGLGNVDNTSDTNKPISTATQTALDGKAATSHTHTASQISDATTTGRSLLTAADAAAARTAIGAGTGSSNLTLGTTGTTAAAGDDSRLSDTRTPTDGSVTTAKIDSATLVTASETIGSNNNDTTIPTSAAVKAYADSVGGSSLPTQTGNSGKYLTTNGTSASWGTPSGSGDMVLASTQTVTGTKTFNAGTLRDRGSAVFDVKAYGALGDNSTNDTAAIQSAINAAIAAGGGTVFFPQGTYLISPTSGVCLTGGSNLILKGAGRIATTLKKISNGIMLDLSGPAADAVNGGASHVRYTNVEDMSFEGNARTGAMIRTYYTGDCRFKNIRFAGNYDIVNDCVEFWDSRFENCVWDTNGSRVENQFNPNVYLRNSVASSGFGYSDDNNNQIHFVGCRWEACPNGAIGIEQGTNNTANPNGIYVTNCKIENNAIYASPIFRVGSSSTHIHVDGLYMFAGRFMSTHTTPATVIEWSAGLSSLENVHIGNGGTATIDRGVDIISVPSNFTTVFRNVVGQYKTAPATSHINFGTVNGEIEIDNCYGTSGTQFSGTVPSAKFGQGVALKGVAGAVSDASFLHTPLDGTLAYDTTNSRLYARRSGSWVYHPSSTEVASLVGGQTTAAGVGVNWYQSGYISGQYYFCGSENGNATSNILANGTARVSPWVVTGNASIVRLFAEFTAAGDAASILRLGIWSDDGTGRPGALVLDAGSISTGSGNAGTVATAGTPGVYEMTISQSLTPGLYWVGGAVQGVTTTQPTIRVINTLGIRGQIPLGTTLPSTAGLTVGAVSMTGQTGAFGAFSLTGQTTLAPRIGFRVS